MAFTSEFIQNVSLQITN